jgi:hypothetical protein
VDLQAFFRARIESALIQASWSDAVRYLLGLTGVSQVWEERPAWHFWLEGEPGAHSLRLEEWGELQAAGGESWRLGRFAVRFYPDPAGSAFSRFAPAERDLVADGVLDPVHHVPRSDREVEIPDRCFQVGAIEFAARSADDSLAVRVDALSLARERAPSGQVLREVPAWDLTLPLFDRLAGLFSHHLRRPPCRLVVRREPGFEWTTDADGASACQETGDVALTTAYLLFGNSADDPWRDPAAGPAALDLAFPPGEHPPQSLVQREGIVNSLWWSLAQGTFHSMLSSTCGCAECHGAATS